MTNKTKEMRCADEDGFPLRTFHMEDGDGTCAHCGWMQTSFGAGLTELLNLARWNDEGQRARYAALAAAERTAQENFATIRETLSCMIDANNDVENVATYRSPDHITATRRGNALRAALTALEDAV